MIWYFLNIGISLCRVVKMSRMFFLNAAMCGRFGMIKGMFFS